MILIFQEHGNIINQKDSKSQNSLNEGSIGKRQRGCLSAFSK